MNAARAFRSAFGLATFAALGVACTGGDVLLYRVESDGSGGAFESSIGSGGTSPQNVAGNGGEPAPSSGGTAGVSGRGASGSVSSAGGRNAASGGAAGSGARPVVDVDAGSGGAGAGAVGAGGSGAQASGGSSTGGAGALAPCSSTADCAAGWMCQKLDCAAPTGLCAPRPILCDQTPVPFCGCDGITYWNDCLRQQNGIESSTAGQCTLSARVCSVATDCNATGSSCAHVIPTATPCGSSGPGTCWILPNDCSAVPPTIEWMQCQLSPFGNNPPGTTFPCVDTCTAIRSGQEYVGVPSPTMCSK